MSSILVDWQIREAIEKGYIKVDPFREDLINPASLDIRLGSYFNKVNTSSSYYAIDPLDKDSFTHEPYISDVYFLQPGELVLASMFEHTELAPNICAKLYGKSSLGRLGLINSAHAGWVDNSWTGVLTMELSNVSRNIIKLSSGMKIGQLVFEETDTPNQDYQQVGRYSNQQPGSGSLGI